MTVQMENPVGGLVLAAFVLGLLVCSVRLLDRALRRRPLGEAPGAVALLVAAYLVFYFGVALRSRPREIAPGGRKCFDDWCVAVVATERAVAIGPLRANGEFVVVTLDVASQAKRVAQRPDRPTIRLVDAAGRGFPPSPAGGEALASLRGAQRPLDDRIGPQETYRTNLVFEVPATATTLRALVLEGLGQGAWPSLIVGDETSLLHAKTYLRLRYEPTPFGTLGFRPF